MHIEKFIQTDAGRVLMSIILGVGLATLFKVSCKGKNCLIMKAPSLDNLNDKIYKIEDKCYKFKSNPIKCDTTKEMYEFA
jgi:hypothetical protein